MRAFLKSFKVAALLLSLFSLSSCKVEPVSVTVNSGGLTCAATTSLSTVISGESFPVTIQALGGVGPYQLSGKSGNFSGTVTVPRTLTLSSGASQVLSSGFTVTDSSGNSTTCQLTVTVTEEDEDPLSCTATASTETPAINESVTYTITAAGGSGGYVFTGFVPGGNGVGTASLTKISNTQATAGAKYPTAGLNTAVFYLADSSGNQANCAKTVNVQGTTTASVSLSASPSSTVPASQSITITAIPSGFTSTPTYNFTLAGSGLYLSYSGAIATVSAADSTITRTGVITVTASNGTQSATNTITVTFTAQSSTLNCTIGYTSGTYYPGQNVSYSIVATSGEALTVTQINVQDGYVVGGTPSQYPYINFYTSGYKTVTARARSASTGTLCNNGALLESTIYISPTASTLSCSLSLTPNPSYPYRWILATVTASGTQGNGFWLESLTAQQMYLDTATTSYDSVWNYEPSISRWVYFVTSGNFKVTARIRDAYGRTATCDTYEVIYGNAYTSPSQFCGINPATGFGACTMIYRDSYYYDGSSCRYYGVTSGCAAAGVFSSRSECEQTVLAGRCGSWQRVKTKIKAFFGAQKSTKEN